MLLLPSAAWGQGTITVAGITPDGNGDFIDPSTSSPISGVTFYAQTNTLTLNDATLGTDSDPCVILCSLENLTINLDGVNTLYGYILKPNDLDNSESYSLAFSGGGSLVINSKEDWTYPINGFTTVNLNGFCIASTDHYGVFWNRENNRFEGKGVNYVEPFYNMTVTKNAYPIWVYYSGDYIQLTPTNKTINQPESTGTISYDGETSTLTLSSCNYSTGESLHAFYIGEGLDQNTLNVFLDGQNTIESKSDCFMIPLASPNGTATLDFSTNATTPGSLEISTNSYGSITHSGVTVLCNNNLRYNGNKVATNLAQLKIGDTEITGGVSNLDGYPGVSFDATNNILTLSSATIGASIISYIDDLTINLEGTNTISGGISILKTAIGSLKFTGSNDCSLTINNAGSSSSGAAIYNFTSVDFGSFNLSSSTSPGVYYKTDKDDPNSYQSWTNHIGDGGFTVSNITLTKKTLFPLWIQTDFSTFVQITEDNMSDVLGDKKVTFDGKQTLTLSEVNMTASIVSGISALTIMVDKVNSIQGIGSGSGDSISTCIRNIAPGASLTLQKSTNGTPSLSLTGGSVIGNFSTINYAEGGLYLHAYSGSDPAPDAYFSYEGLVGATKAEFTTESLDYILKIGDTSINESVTINSGDNENDAIIRGSITFSIDENNNGILTLDNVMLSNDENDVNKKIHKILSYLPNLTINIKGTCEIGKVISTYSNATLTLELAEGADDESKLMTQIGNKKPFWEGFAGTPTFKDNLCFLPDDDREVVEKLPTPHLSIVDGELEIGLSGSNLDQMHKFYSVDFVEGNDVELKEYNNDSPETIDKPCTVTAYTEFEDVFGVKRQSEIVTGKYFGIADKTIVFNNETKGSELKIDDLEIIPATKDEGVSFTIISANNQDVISSSFSQETGSKYSISGIGICPVVVRLSLKNSIIQVLNPKGIDNVINIEGKVTVLPDKPTIVKEEKDYLDTDKITITRTSVEGESADNIKIFYTWDEEAEIGSDYTHDTTNPTLTIYTDAIPAQSGTLRAWVGYSLGDGEYLMSEEATPQKFEVKKDIASCTVILPENAPYKGSAYEPVVEESAATTTTLSLGTDYTVSYQKVEGETATEVESMIDAGTYKITITGKGNYGGTKEISDFQIAQASLADAAISKLIVGDKEYTSEVGKVIEIPYTGEAIQPEVVVIFNDVTVDASEYTVSYGENNTEVSNETAIASVTVTSTGKNFITGTSTSLNFKIVPAPVTITAEAQTVTYNAKQQAYTGASVNNENAALVIAYYTSKEDRTNALNALTGAPTDAGTYYVSVTLNEESQQHYTAEPANVTFTIAQLNISEAVITLDNEELTYNGEEQSVNVTKVMAGDIEVPIDCYEISGNTGTKAENYTLIVTAKTVSNGNEFKNNFTGSAEKAWKINHRTIPAEVIAEKFTSEGQTYATFNDASESFLAPQGIVAYIITGVSGNSVTVKAVSYIKAGTPVLLQKTSTSTETEETTDGIFATNILKYAEGDLTANGGQYVLYKNEFVKATGSITSGKCYLDLTGTSFAGTRGFSIAGGAEGTTAISDAVVDSDHSEWFDLQGRKIEKPSKKGLYIRDGKKIVVK